MVALGVESPHPTPPAEGVIGWILVSDYGDMIFQREPFKGMGRPTGDELFFVEEYMGKNATDRRGVSTGGRGIDNTHWFTYNGVKVCHGDAEAQRMGHTPVLNAGSIAGAREPMINVLKRLQTEFEKNVASGKKCDPENIADQATLNYLFYTGAFADLHPKTWKYGEGPIITIGVSCGGGGKDHSATDIIRIRDGSVLNKINEPANVVHQDKECFNNFAIPYVQPRFEQISTSWVLTSFRKNVDAA